MNEPRARFLVGEQVFLSPVDEADLELYVRWLNAPGVRENLMIQRPLTTMAEREWLDTLDKRGDIVFGVRRLVDDALIGNTGLHRVNDIDRHAEFGIFIGPPQMRRKGYGSEAVRLTLAYAFDVLNLHRVWLRYYAHNAGAAKVYEDCGFVHEGVARRAHWYAGAWHDEHLMGILAEEYYTARDA